MFLRPDIRFWPKLKNIPSVIHFTAGLINNNVVRRLEEKLQSAGRSSSYWSFGIRKWANAMIPICLDYRAPKQARGSKIQRINNDGHRKTYKQWFCTQIRREVAKCRSFFFLLKFWHQKMGVCHDPRLLGLQGLKQIRATEMYMA